MTPKPCDTEILKRILEKIDTPELLDDHPWVSRPFVRDTVARQQHLRGQSPGHQLVAALAELFSRAMPGSPPRRGKRLDTQWGAFGILAARYFAPLQLGAPAPVTLRDAWGQIDQSILLYVNGHENGAGPASQTERYGLVGAEPEVAPISTLSDWHRKGIQRLAEAVAAREQYLQRFPAQQAPPGQEAASSQGSRRGQFRKAFLIVLIILVFVLTALGVHRGRQIYDLGMTVRADLYELRGAAVSPTDLKALTESGALLSRTRQDFDVFVNEVEPFLWLGPRLGWAPVYGGDLAASREILEMAGRLLESADTTFVASRPLLAALESGQDLNPPRLVRLLGEARPQLLEASESLDRAVRLRAELDLNRLSPLTRSLIERDLDPLLPVMQDGLGLATALPHVLGAASDGPKTYLLLVQNEDELRPTGGFITAAGTLVIANGEVLSLTFSDSGELENWDMPYPQAPWQLEQYMNSPVLILRDANWFTHFPTSALYAESLYAYSNSHSVDGVIAFDQHMLVLVLSALGPLEVEGASEPIGAENVIAYMRSAKSPPADQPVPADWSRKGFMDKITRAILVKIFAGGDVPWQSLGRSLSQGLDEYHLLLQLDDSTAGAVVARHGWDGALQYAGGDFLMVVDANVGFNKTNAVVDTTLSYDVDLTDPAHPLGALTVIHKNNASPDVPCTHWGGERPEDQELYPIDACYWNYMRVYVPSGAELLDATPQSVPDEWMILNRGVDGPVDILDEELDGLQAFGELMVVPGGESTIASFEYRLPEPVLVRNGEQVQYHLHVQKQPGTGAIPIVIRIHMPNGARLESSVPDARLEGNHLYFEANLSTDLDLEIIFQLK